MNKLTPREIVRELNRYIIGQEDAKKAVAVALNTAYGHAPDPDTVVWLPLSEPNGEEGVYSGQAIAFFTEYRAMITLAPDGTADMIEIYERPAGTQDWAYSPMSQAFAERPLQLPLPLDQDTLYAAAA